MAKIFKKILKKKIAVVFLLALFFRLILSLGPYHGDINNHVAWATFARDAGFRKLYEVDFDDFSEPNYLPLAMLCFITIRSIYDKIFSVLWLINVNILIFPSNLIFWYEQNGIQVMMKLPAILADVGIGWLIYRFLKRKKKKDALKWTAAFLFNPAVFYLSAFWGQIESLVLLFVLLATILLLKRKAVFGAGTYILSLLVKPLALIFAPIVFILFWRLKPNKIVWLNSIALSLLIIFIFSIPFSIGEPIFWFGKLYLRILPGPEDMHYLTANAFNFWAVTFGLDQRADEAMFHGLQYRMWGILLMLLPVLLVLIKFWQAKKFELVLQASILISLATFLFMTRMHERYLFAVIPFLAVLAAESKKWRWIYALLSLTVLLNLYHDWWVPRVNFLVNILSIPISVKILSTVNLVVFLWLWLDFLKVRQWRFSKSE